MLRVWPLEHRCWGAIWKWSETVTYGCRAICCSRPTWLKSQMHDFPEWHGWRTGCLGPLLTTIVAAVVDWLLRLEIAQKLYQYMRASCAFWACMRISQATRGSSRTQLPSIPAMNKREMSCQSDTIITAGQPRSPRSAKRSWWSAALYYTRCSKKVSHQIHGGYFVTIFHSPQIWQYICTKSDN